MDLDLSLDEIIARRKNRWPGLPSSYSYSNELPDPRQARPSYFPVDRVKTESELVPGGTFTDQRKQPRRKADKRRERRKRKRTARAVDQPVTSLAHRYKLRSPFSPSSSGIPSEIDQASRVFRTLRPNQKGNITVKSVYIGPFPIGIKVAEVKAMMELCIGLVKEARAVQGGKTGKGGGGWIKVDFVGGKGWKVYRRFNGAFLDASIQLEVIPVILR